MAKPLKLIAQTAEDIPVFSTLMQDAVIRIEDMAWLPDEHRFALIGNRFIWEEKKRFFKPPKGLRIRTGLHINNVLKVETFGLSLGNSEEILDLLSIEAQITGEETILLFTFAGSARIRLTTECVDAVLADLGEPWEASGQPKHN